jgi:hypothetical protein
MFINLNVNIYLISNIQTQLCVVSTSRLFDLKTLQQGVKWTAANAIYGGRAQPVSWNR